MPNDDVFANLPDIPYSDVEEIVDLLAQVSDPTEDLTTNERKLTLAKGLVRLADADTYMWNTCVANFEVPGDAMATSFIDGGWKNDVERNDFLHALTHSEIGKVTGEGISREVELGNCCTVTRQQKYSDAEWAAISPNEFRDMGLGEYMFSMVPLGGGGFSCIGLHRRVGRPPFSMRDRALVHVVFTNAGWIHSDGLSIESGKIAIRLTPREREVLLHLLRGDSQKLIANKLEIGVHTVGDHMKQIYKQFDVKTRGQLLGRFIAPTA